MKIYAETDFDQLSIYRERDAIVLRSEIPNFMTSVLKSSKA